LLDALTGMASALEGDTAMQTICDTLRENQNRPTDSPFRQWYLERTELTSSLHMARVDIAEGLDLHPEPVAPKWQWQNPFGDCSFVIGDGEIVIHAANARDLRDHNKGAPRFVCNLTGDFALQSRCSRASIEKPAQGGILIWQNLIHFLRLDWGSRGLGEVTFWGCIDQQDTIIGRGKLHTTHAYLRLERKGSQMHALCSDDSKAWYTAGQVEFPVNGSFEVGVYASGSIDRLLYPGRYPDGTTIRFSELYLSS
jgi:regulation of enolase protein 1 (concanavalin A-like superfamily)